jgi:hypothetical protein
VAEIIHPQDGDAVELQPCPAWCTLNPHFADDGAIHAEDGFHHYGPEIVVPTSDRVFTDGPETVVKVMLKSWTSRLDAEPGPGRVELQLATTEQDTDMYVELTPGEARVISSALLELADNAERTDAARTHPDVTR